VRTAGELRADFLLDRSIAHLNHGSFGAQAPQMVAFPVPHRDATALQQELRDRHRIEIPAREVDGRTLVRLSVAAYTTEEDCQRLVEALTVPKNAKSR